MTISSKSYVPLLIAAVAITYAVTLQHGFVWDDNIYMVGNRIYQDFDVAKIVLSSANGVEYLPLRDLTYALDFAIWGSNPLGFHLTNLILFLGNVLLVFALTTHLPLAGNDVQGRKLTAFLTALLFSVHPLLSESVNFITCRNVLLSGVFFFMGAFVFARHLRNNGQSAVLPSTAIAACMLGALLSKATSITLPLVLLLLAVYVPSKHMLRHKALCITPTFLLAGLFIPFFRGVAERSLIINPAGDAPLAEKLATALQIPFFYLRKMLIPAGLSAEYAADGLSQILASPEVLICSAGLSAFAVAAFVLRRRAPVAGFSLLWFVVTLLPVSNLFATYPVVADRYAYLPLFAFVFPAASLLTRCGSRYPKPVAGAVIVLVLGLGSMSFVRSLDWRSDTTLWQANVKTEPANAKGYQNLAAEAIIAGDLPLARQTLAEGRSKAPSPMYDYLDGRIHYLEHDPGKALRSFEAAVQQDSDHIRSLLAIGIVYQELGNLDKAAAFYRRTLEAKAVDSWGCRNQARERLSSLGR